MSMNLSTILKPLHRATLSNKKCLRRSADIASSTVVVYYVANGCLIDAGLAMTDQKTDNAVVEEARQTYERTEKWVRRGGMILLFGLVLVLVIPMVIGAIQGINEERVKDPFTGQPVAVDTIELDCLEEAGELVYLALDQVEEDRRWEQRYRRWLARCQNENPGVYRLLRHSRNRMRGGEEPPQMGRE